MYRRVLARPHRIKPLWWPTCSPTKPQIHARFFSSAQHDRRTGKQFLMPAEWSRHSHTITVWPDFLSYQDEDILQSARSEVSAIANAIARFEPVTMYTKPQNVEKARATVSERVVVRPLQASQLWVRDTGPIFVKNALDGSQAGLSLSFNYWGNKIPSEGDEMVASNVLSDMGVQVATPGFRTEGGGIEVDGEGTLLATESAIINPNRNHELTKAQLEEQFKRFLGIDKTIWLRGVKGYDITDYHIDAFARFVAPGKVLIGRPPNSSEKFIIQAYKQARQVLDTETDASGRRLEVIEIAEPHPTQLLRGESVEDPDVTFASYVNYLLVNDGLIVPRFGIGKMDDDALELYRRCFPGREIVQVDINTLPRSGGGIHCATQQVPFI
ncbi:agmatine deiminase [Fusarium albosuccineum]|uniref:Agmatine deiminase n=1 Tax=Fusarium albosuccineum TaxID=1237068 RepID=A0A8H4P5J2_9HYPO|nr:agmatine deiminase [Fusarium albosuccineum]